MTDANERQQQGYRPSSEAEKGYTNVAASHDKEISPASSSLEHRNEIAESPLDEEPGHARINNATAGDLEKIQTNRSARSKFSLKSSAPPANVNDADSIPDGGLTAWLQVLGSFFLFFNSWGIINTFGVYQTFYSTQLLSNSTPAAIAWIGSVQAFFLGMISPLIGPLYDAGYFRLLVATGSFLVVFGHMMLSLCTEYWQVFLAQAVCVGIGAGCLFVPSVAILSTYFKRRLATATGVSAAGSSLGGTLYPIVVYRLIPMVGFAWATRIIAFIALAGLIVSNVVMKVRVLPSEKRKVLDLPAFKEGPFTLFVLGGIFAFLGLYAVFVFVESYCIQEHVTSENLAFYTLAIINSSSMLGRIIPNIIADRLGPFNVITPAAFISGILAFCFIAVKTTGPLVALCVLYGFFSGTLVSLPPTVFVSVSLHKRHMIGTRMGMGFFFVDIGLLLGTPISGWILDASSFTFVWIFGGGSLLLGSALMFLGRAAQVKSFKLNKRA